jgi:anti-anti-sigma regulatory factor
MELSDGRNLLIDRPSAGVWIVRFTRPDLRVQLDGAGVEDCELYKELTTSVLNRISAGESVVLNFGLVHWFPTAFYQVLLQVREAIQKRKGKLFLCGFIPENQESIRLFKGDKVFKITHTEEQAVKKASK